MGYVYLAVEGPLDQEFIARILVHLGFRRIGEDRLVPDYWKPLIPTTFPPRGRLDQRVRVPLFLDTAEHSVAIAVAGSRLETFAASIELDLQALNTRADLAAIGLVADSDRNDPMQLLRSEITAINEGAKLELPAIPGIVSAGVPRLGTFLFPDNRSPGTIEDLLLDCAESAYPDLLALATPFVLEGQERLAGRAECRELEHHSGPKKAILSALAGLLKPGKTIQASLADHRWVSPETIALPRIATFVRFLKDLTGVN